MPKLPFFTGDFYQLDDPGASSEQIINMYCEVLESGTGKAVGRLVNTPGKQLFAMAGAGPIRCLWMGEGRMFCVSGSGLYEVYGDGTSSLLGDVGIEAGTPDDPPRPAQLFANGREILVISAGFAWRVYGDADSVIHVDHIKLIEAEYTDLADGVKTFYFDLHIDAATATMVSSTARPFVAAEDVGLVLRIPDLQTGFTAGDYTITAVTSGVATLSAPLGTLDATGGVGYLLDGYDISVNSSTLPFTADDIGGTLVFPDPGAAGWTPGTYRIVNVTTYGAAVLDSSPAAIGTLGGIATEYPGDSETTDADGNLRAGTGAYLDGYGIIAPPVKPGVLMNHYYINDPTTGGFDRWLAIDKGIKEGYPDNILALFADHEELYVFGDLQSTEVHRDTGAANFPFERDMSAFLHFGLCAKDSVTQLGTNGIAFIAWSANRGAPEAWYVTGFQPQRISTHALENQWRTYPNVRDAVAYSYVEDGHHFYVISFPSADVTWAYDLTASQQMGKPMWHARLYWDGAQFRRDRAWLHTHGYFLTGTGHDGPDWTKGLSHFAGDWEIGAIYVQGLYTYTDMGAMIKRQLIFPHLSNDNKRTVWHLFQLDCRVGSGDADVIWTLDYSRDKAHTFVGARSRTAASGGPTNQRLRWWRCGESFDQVWRLETVSAAPISITNAYFEAKPAAS